MHTWYTIGKVPSALSSMNVLHQRTSHQYLNHVTLHLDADGHAEDGQFQEVISSILSQPRYGALRMLYLPLGYV